MLTRRLIYNILNYSVILLIYIDIHFKISNVLEVAVNNVDMNSISNSSFRLIGKKCSKIKI